MAETAMETDENVVDTEKNSSEEYAYLDRGGFSSEKFKIEVRGLPKFYGIAELKKLMNQKLNLNTSKIKRPKNGSHWLYACFQNDEERTKAIAALNGYVWKGKTLIAEEAKPAPDPLVRKRRQDDENPQDKKKKEDDKSQEERLMDATTPYWNIPYDEQLTLKEKEIRHILMKFDNEVWKLNKEFRKRIEDNRKIHNGLSFQLKPIQRSPVTEGYRNKCEFTVGIDEETKLPTVGFRLGSYATGTVAVAPIHGLKHISDKAKKAVLIFQDFVRKSNMAPFSPADYSGYWRYLMVRNSASNGDVMLIVSMHPQTLSEEEIDKIKKDLIDHFSSEDTVACGIKSLYFEVITKKRVGEQGSKPQHLMGETHIIDTILGRQFRISPEAFFQINTAGAEILYQTAIDMSEVNKDSSVIDICCGTGTIGLCFAKHCNKVLGLELIPEAVKDAKSNAELNKIDNCEFFTGKAEDILPSVLARLAGIDVVAIVDPPRAGLHMRAVTQLRNNRSVKRLVYISCSPASAVKNFVDLSRQSSKTLRGAPFVPVAAVPVDMFPHTRHVELAILFEREQHCNKVLGLELIPEAVKDAKSNAELNKIDNCEFFTGKAEDILPSVLARLAGIDVVAIVDPPRAGLHMRAVTQLRNNRSVKRLVYISCSPASAVKNFVDLSRQSSKTLRGAPFVPVAAVPVDMFPHTRHVELAILFEREQHCNKVLGLELIPEAVKDAKSNAELNKIDNCEFFTGKAEDILPSVLARLAGIDVVAIVDPPRAGLHMRAVTQLRNNRSVKRLVYISCSPASAVKNFVDLSRQSSKTLRGAPFVPVAAVPVDMFPHTRHVELAILFEREQEPKIDSTTTQNSEIKMDNNDTSENVQNESSDKDDNSESVQNESSKIEGKIVT